VRFLLGIALLAACSDAVPDPEGAVLAPPTLDAPYADVLVPGSRVVLLGSGFLAPPAGTTRVRLEGAVDGRAVAATLAPDPVEPTRLSLVADGLFRGTAGRFTGTATVVVRPADQPVDLTASTPIELRFAPSIAPVLASLGEPNVAPGALLAAQGDGILSGDEGTTALLLDGTFQPDEGPARPVRDGRLRVVEGESRREGTAYLDSGLFGIRPGSFDGVAWLETTAVDGTVRTSEALDAVRLRQQGPALADIQPRTAGRGQIVTVTGRGILPNDPTRETATLLRAEGTFTPADGGAPVELSGPSALKLLPETWIDDGEARVVLRTRFDPATGELTGLGSRPGTFDGQVVMEIFAGQDRLAAPPVPLHFEVAPMTQAVYLAYQPGFSEGLGLFGLQGAERAVRDRILEVCRRDYAGFRVEFAEVPPEGRAEFVTVEIGGRDPNGRGLLGLDNTPGKDDENLRLDELLGGRNAETEAAGSLPYGGIFLESFLSFSPDSPEPATVASPRFDEVFGPFSPAVDPDGARPFGAGERPSGARAAQLADAVRVLGNLVGSTVTHEVGHTLGLARVPYGVHNLTDIDRELMDSGENRPFCERAELDGCGPATFQGENRAYLERLLGDGP
jgi:hypothetical protein